MRTTTKNPLALGGAGDSNDASNRSVIAPSPGASKVPTIGTSSSSTLVSAAVGTLSRSRVAADEEVMASPVVGARPPVRRYGGSPLSVAVTK